MSRRTPLLHPCSLFFVLLTACSPSLLTAAPPVSALTSSEVRFSGAPEAASTLDEAREAWARGEALRRVGEREAAVAVLQPFVGHADPTIAGQTDYLMALLRLELGTPSEAAGALEALLSRFPRAANASFLLAVARRQSGDCDGASGALAGYLALSNVLAPYAALQLADCSQQAGDSAAVLARTDEVLQQGAPRLLRVDALERQAGVLEKAGDLAGALGRYEQLLDLARARNYKADVRLSAARLSVALGQKGRAVDHLVAAVNEVPSAERAAAALDRLAALQAQDRVSFYQAGLVRFYARDYAGAMRNFDRTLATPSEAPNHPAAIYFRAVSRVRQGDEIEGAADLLRLPGLFPGSSYAPDALLRGGKVLESNGRLRDAAAAYRRAANDYPASDEAKEALFRLGLVDLLRDAPGEAGEAWGQLGATDAQPDLRALGLLWQGKLVSRAGDPATARAQWQRAADLAPTWYGGLRARGLLDSGADPLTRPARLDPARLELSSAELAELDAWTSARGASLDTLATELSADPALARADELLALDLNISAGWEFDDLAGRYAGDPARLAGLALALHRRGQDGPALKQAQNALDAALIVSRQAPTALQKLLYPLPYPEVFVTHSEQQGVDPLLFASLVRQESMFDPAARSAAGAMGLTQIIAPTAREIAGALGRSGFQLDDLFRPSVSLEFGAFYFGQRLKRFGGALYPALAAYNAGDGSADRWIGDYGLADVDLFAERIPYNETNHYVKVVFENYGLYRALYAQG